MSVSPYRVSHVYAYLENNILLEYLLTTFQRFLTIYYSIGRFFQDGVDKVVAESLPNVWRCPQELDWHLLLEYDWRTGAYSGTGGNDDNTTEKRYNAEYSESRYTSNPQVRGGAANLLRSPITSPAYNQRIALLSWYRHGRKAMPLR